MPRSSRLLVALALGLASLAAPVAHGRPATNDPVFEQGLQWGLARIGATSAWERGGGEGITIAVVDSGIDLAHEDLSSKLDGQVSCIGSRGDSARCTGSAQDDNGHGTHVSGIALAATDNGRGIAGVAPDARLLAVRVLANDCSSSGCTASGTAADVSAGIHWAVDHGADVVNLSLGGDTLQSALGCAFCDAIDYAWSKGAIAVIAAGNDSVLPSGFGDEPAVIVTATTRDDTHASYSNASSGIFRVARWPVAAPGGEAETDPSDCGTGGSPKGVLSTYWASGQHNQYACLAGTSMAAPHVSGALAVLLGTGLSPQAAIDRLLSTATDLGPAGRDSTFGYGRIDLARAVGPAPAATTTPTTSAPPTTPPTVSTPTAPPSTAAATPTTAPRLTPPVTTPDTSTAAPFSTDPADNPDDPPGWLIATAVAAVLASATATGSTAWRRTIG
ncbi:MAG: S8 family serine peptidase [Acidimicrobiales bacterium]